MLREKIKRVNLWWKKLSISDSFLVISLIPCVVIVVVVIVIIQTI